MAGAAPPPSPSCAVATPPLSAAASPPLLPLPASAATFGVAGGAFSRLVEELRAQLGGRGGGPLAARAGVSEALRAFEDDGDELAAASFFDPDRAYTRNLVAHEDGLFTLLLLCWTPGKASAIHDHPCAHGCFMRVLDGAVVERRFARKPESNSLSPAAVSEARAGAVLFIEDCEAVHSVGNADATVRARTLHLYAPPFTSCAVWLQSSWPLDKPLRPSVCFFSRFGVLCGNDDAAAAAKDACV
jgi:cysteine dioxygenase